MTEVCKHCGLLIVQMGDGWEHLERYGLTTGRCNLWAKPSPAAPEAQEPCPHGIYQNDERQLKCAKCIVPELATTAYILSRGHTCPKCEHSNIPCAVPQAQTDQPVGWCGHLRGYGPHDGCRKPRGHTGYHSNFHVEWDIAAPAAQTVPIPEDLRLKYAGSTFPAAYEKLVPDLSERLARAEATIAEQKESIDSAYERGFYRGQVIEKEREVDRFWSKVNKEGPEWNGTRCWVWKGSPTIYGYGQYTLIGRQKTKAHRHAYEVTVGPIPEGLDLDHLCRNTMCVNPSHLEPVTNKVNRERAVISRRQEKTHCPKGHPYTEDNMRIRETGVRVCLICNRARQHEYRRKRDARATGKES